MFYRPHERHPAPHSDEVVTKQAMKAECDINNILKQYQKTGILTHVQSARPTYTDLPNHLDYQDALNIIIESEDAFLNLPSKVRSHFENDPQQFLAAFSDPTQADTLREFGLLKPLPDPTLRTPQPSSTATAAAPPPKADPA